jgi:hypothetical protein
MSRVGAIIFERMQVGIWLARGNKAHEDKGKESEKWYVVWN